MDTISRLLQHGLILTIYEETFKDALSLVGRLQLYTIPMMGSEMKCKKTHKELPILKQTLPFFLQRWSVSTRRISVQFFNEVCQKLSFFDANLGLNTVYIFIYKYGNETLKLFNWSFLV